jgi:hypothetical protein
MSAPITQVAGFYLTSRPGKGTVVMVADHRDHILTSEQAEELIAALQAQLAVAAVPGGYATTSPGSA